MATTEEQTAQWYDDASAMTQQKVDARTSLRNESNAPSALDVNLTPPVDMREDLRNSSGFDTPVTEVPETQPASSGFEGTYQQPTYQQPTSTQPEMHFGAGGATAEELSASVPQTTEDPWWQEAAMKVAFPSTEGSYKTNNNTYEGTTNSLQDNWNTRVSNLNGATSAEYASSINEFVVDALRAGWSAERIDAAMLWTGDKAGTTSKWIADNGINVENKVSTSTGLYQNPSNPVQETYNTLLRLVQDGTMQGDEAIGAFVDMTVNQANTNPSQIDSQMLWPAGTTQAWMDKQPGISTVAPTSTTTGAYEGAVPTSQPAGTSGANPSTVNASADGSAIGMSNMTNVSAVNTAVEGQIVRDLFKDDTAYAQALIDQGVYDPENAFDVSFGVERILDENGPLMKSAQGRTQEVMSGMGRVGDSAYAGAVTKAMVEAALPIAQGDVQVSMFNAGEYNRMMDKRQSLFGEAGLGYQRGGLAFLGEMQQQTGEIIQQELKYSFDKALADDKYAHELAEADKVFEQQKVIDNMGYVSNILTATNGSYNAINASNMTPTEKDEAMAIAAMNQVSQIQTLASVADGVDINYDDFGLDLTVPDDTAKYPTVNYSDQDLRTFSEKQLSSGDDFRALHLSMNDGINWTNISDKLDAGMLDDKSIQYYEDFRYVASNFNTVRSTAPNSWGNAIDVFIANGWSPETLRSMADIMKAGKDSTPEALAAAERQATHDEMGGF